MESVKINLHLQVNFPLLRIQQQVMMTQNWKRNIEHGNHYYAIKKKQGNAGRLQTILQYFFFSSDTLFSFVL